MSNNSLNNYVSPDDFRTHVWEFEKNHRRGNRRMILECEIKMNNGIFYLVFESANDIWLAWDMVNRYSDRVLKVVVFLP